MGKYEAVEAVHGAVDTETLADLKRLAAHMNCSVDHLVATAVIRFVNDEIGVIEDDPFVGFPPYQDSSIEGRALDEAEARAGAALAAFLKVGEDDIAAGRVHSQEEVEAMFKVKWEKRNAA